MREKHKGAGSGLATCVVALGGGSVNRRRHLNKRAILRKATLGHAGNPAAHAARHGDQRGNSSITSSRNTAKIRNVERLLDIPRPYSCNSSRPRGLSRLLHVDSGVRTQSMNMM